MLHLLTVCALYVCLCDYVNICMYLVLLSYYVYVYSVKSSGELVPIVIQKPNSNKVFLSYLILQVQSRAKSIRGKWLTSRLSCLTLAILNLGKSKIS